MTQSTAADQGHPLRSGWGHCRASARSGEPTSAVAPGEPFAAIPSRPHHSRTLGSEQQCPVAPRRGHPDRLPECAGPAAGIPPSRRRNAGD